MGVDIDYVAHSRRHIGEWHCELVASNKAEAATPLQPQSSGGHNGVAQHDTKNKCNQYLDLVMACHSILISTRTTHVGTLKLYVYASAAHSAQEYA